MIEPETSREVGASLVRLTSFPVRLFRAAEAGWEGLLREYALRGLGGTAQSYHGEEIARAGHALQLVADAVGTTSDATPMVQHARTVELAVVGTGDFAVLQAVLDDARRLALAGELLTLPPLPEVIALRDWFCNEVTEQAAGANPRAWQLPAESDAPSETAAAQWDGGLTPPPDRAWLVGDDRNRIVAASPAALTLLGWAEQDLVGQRLLAVIPRHLREAHIAGFTRSVVTGHAPLLGQPLSLPALTRDDRQIPITLTLTRHPARNGRHVYLALLG